MAGLTDYISTDFSPLEATMKVADAAAFFEEVAFTHFPVIDGGIYIGSLATDDLETFDPDKIIGDYRYAMEGFFARSSMIWMDVLEVFARNHTNVVPVLDDQNRYVGYYEVADVIRCFNETPFLKEPGAIIIVEKGATDYSMGQVVQIVESNNGKVLGLFISEASSDKVQVTIKLSIGGLNEILQTFRRYNYEIVSEHQEDNYLNSLRERSDYLDKYLNI